MRQNLRSSNPIFNRQDYALMHNGRNGVRGSGGDPALLGLGGGSSAGTDTILSPSRTVLPLTSANKENPLTVYFAGHYVKYGGSTNTDLSGFSTIFVENVSSENKSVLTSKETLSLSGSVCTKSGINYLQNDKQPKKCSETLELTAAAKAILHLIGEYKKDIPPNFDHIVFCGLNSYVEKAITSSNTAEKHKHMIQYIRGHWKTLTQLLSTKNVTIEWKTHNVTCWKERCEYLADIESRRGSLKYAKERNRSSPNFHNVTDEVTNNIHEFTQLDPTSLGSDSLYIRYENVPLLQIPEEHIGILNLLCPTSKHIKYRQHNKLRSIFNFV